MITIPHERLRDLVAEVFATAGCSRAEATRIATYLVGANLAGHDSHGVIRVPVYLRWLEEGQTVRDQSIKLISDTPVIAVIDGQFGFGQTVAPQAVAIGIEKCKAMGLSAIALRNSAHIGRVGDFAEMAAAEGLVSAHFVNAAGSILVAPFGASERRFSTAPFCVGIPRPGAAPLILDFATSLVAEGKALVASRGGKKLPSDALIGPDGAVSGDPHLLYGEYEPTGPRNHGLGKGAIRAFGEHKGSGLALMCELIGGALTGNGATKANRRFSNGMLSIFIDPKRIDASDFFPEEIARYLAFVKSAKPVVAGEEVLVPGEPEERARKDRMAKGVPLAEDAWAAIIGAAREIGVPEAAIEAAGKAA
jgi:hydroxycarboxylate dehydrogenase B